MIFSIAEILIALTGGVILLLALWYKPAWGALASISIAGLLDCLGIATATDPNSASSGINIYGDDVACLLLALTGLILVLRYPKRFSRDQALCMLLIGLVVVSVGRGFFALGLKQAGNNARNLLTFAIPALTIMLLRPVVSIDARRVARWLGLAGAILSMIALLRWAGVLAIPDLYVILDQKQLREVVRAVNSDFALVIGQAFIGAIYFLTVERRSGWWWWVAAGLFGSVTLALQHRSVWTAVVAGLAWLIFRTGRISPVRWFALGTAVIIGLGLLMSADPRVLQEANGLITNNVSEAESKNSTWAWRVDGYTEAAQRVLDSDPIDMIIGPPAGSIFKSGGSFASVHIHSRYVDTFANYGFVGTLVLLIWFGMLIRRCRRSRRVSLSQKMVSIGPQAFLQALLISELIYLVPYFGGLLQGSVLGLVWVAAMQRPVQSIRRRSSPAAKPAVGTLDPVVVAIPR